MVVDRIRVNPGPAFWRVPPVSPPIWKTKSFEPVVLTPVSQGAAPEHAGLLDWATGSEGLGSKGFAVSAPETPKAITPYQVSPVSLVVTEMGSEARGDGAMAYHSWTNCPPPMPSWPVLGVKVSPAVSFTEKEVPTGYPSTPTMMTSSPLVVDRTAEQEVTSPHPAETDPSRAGVDTEETLVVADD
jgi:hypothetical protein